MKASKLEIPTTSYPQEHKLLAKELDKVLASKRAKENLTKIDRFLKPFLTDCESTSRPARRDCRINRNKHTATKRKK